MKTGESMSMKAGSSLSLSGLKRLGWLIPLVAIVLFLGTGSGGSIGAAAQLSTTGGMTGGGTPGWTVTYLPTTCVWESHGQYGDSNGAWPSPYNACTVGVGGVNGPPWPTKYGTCACSGTVKAHLVWSGGSTGEPPPPVVLVEEHSSAQWYGDSGDCDCGLPNVVTTPNAGGVLKEGHRWTAVTTNGETSLDVPVTCSPSASAAIAQSSIKDAGGCSAEYHVVLHNVTLEHIGTISASDNRLLVGQELTATIRVDGDRVKTAGALTSASDSIAWTAGGTPFSSYVVSNPPTAATYTAWNTWDDNPTTIFFRTPTDECPVTAEVHLNSIDYDFSATMLVQIKAPIVSITASSVGDGPHLLYNDGSVYIDAFTTPNEYRMFGASYGTSSAGIFLFGTEVQPVAFDPEGYGQWGWCQLVTSWSASFEDADASWWDDPDNFASGVKLDGDYPYNGWHDDSSSDLYRDAPGFLMDSSWLEVILAGNFKLYMMFIPHTAPGCGTMAVPLEVWNWGCDGAASDDPQSLPPWSYLTKSGYLSAGTMNPAHPIWTSRLTSGAHAFNPR